MPTMPTAYPLNLPTVSGTTITIDQMLSEPTRITHYLSDLTLRGLFATDIFTPSGGVTGGAVLYDQLTTNDLYLTRDVQNVEPGAEFPIVTSDRPTPRLAPVEKIGGRLFVTDEARDRNDSTALRREAQKLANNITRKLNARALSTLDAAATEYSRTAVGVNWSAVVTGGASQTNATGWPAADFAKFQLQADTDELGITFDRIYLNPAQANSFKLTYGSEWRSVLDDWGYEMVSTNRVTAGTAYVVASGQVGQFRLEKGLTTETYREERTQRTWIQTDIRPVFVVDGPFGVLKVSGLAG